jgi:transcriptional regulator with XRE-family HTH domain
MHLQEAIAEVLRRERRERGLTVKEVATAAGLSAVYLGEVERGRKSPSPPVLERIAVALTLDMPDLLELVADHLRGPRQGVVTQAIGFTVGGQAPVGPRVQVRRLLQHLEPEEAMTMAELGTFFLARRGSR